jgi:hypothetical protein
MKDRSFARERAKAEASAGAARDAVWKKIWTDLKYKRLHERMDKANHRALEVSSYPKLYTTAQLEAANRAFKRAHKVMQDYEEEFFKKEGVRSW